MSNRPNLDEMLDDLGELVRIESPSRDPVALNRRASVLASIMERRLGSAPLLVDSSAGPHVHWTASSASSILLVGHHDTVFPHGTLASRPFVVEGGKAFGPGVFDMKAGLVQAIHAVASLEDRSGVEILVTSDEEVGSRVSKDLILERARACGAVLVLEPSADGGALKIARKGTGTFELVVHGRAAHAGLEPEKGVNALVEAASQVLKIATFGNRDLGTTVTPTVAAVGTTDNVVPARARVLVDVRAEVTSESDRVDAAMRAEIPVRQGREHGVAVLGIARQHCVEAVLVIADELGPAAHAAIEIIEADDARQRVEAAELRIGLADGASEVVELGHDPTPSPRRRAGPRRDASA